MGLPEYVDFQVSPVDWEAEDTRVATGNIQEGLDSAGFL